ncbi:prostatic acid phosphatase-like [Sitodiplosis mosellana]|uniref:prostatic acid phosphatase-like n=1 Tax=Sitodiplosis mosellana TaxID=263140 RepID=UPI002444C209|nr:prostatic acid phosphatase-like [Sitodiplosis mosellana]
MTVLNKLILVFLLTTYIQSTLCDLSSKTSNKPSNESSEDDELVFAQIIYRHGNRSILYTYPNDPYKNESFWPGGYGIITNAGKRRQFELGKYLRRRYERLIGTEYTPKNVYIRSSDVDRTLISALSNAAGMFPPSGEQIWRTNFLWQPVPIHTIPLKDDYLVYQAIPCPKFDELRDQYITESPEVKGLMRKHRSLLAELEKHSGMKIRTILDAAIFNDPFEVELNRELTLPDWANKILNTSKETLEYFAAVYFQSATRTTDAKKAIAGFLIREIFDRFKNKTLALLNPDSKIHIYSAHDNTITNTLNALDLYDMRIPPLAASVHFEMYRRGTEYYIQIFYRKFEFEDVAPINIPNCGTKCPLEDLYRLYADILPTDSESYESLCNIP